MSSRIDGITLVALVVTIVILLILAGITLTFVMGENSVFSKASQAKIQTELGKIEERAQIIYSDKMMQTASSNLNTTVETSVVIEQLKSEDYPIEQRPVKEGDITGISLDKTTISIGKTQETELRITYEGANDPYIYYAEVEGKYYQMHSNKGFITIDREASNLTKADFDTGEGTEDITSQLTISIDNTSIVEAKLKEGSTKIIEVKALTVEGTAKITVKYGSLEEKTCNVTVRDPILATEVTLNETAYTVTGGQSWTNNLQLVATVKPENADNKEVTWKSSNNSIATVDSNGLVKAGKTGGEVTITATTKDGSNQSATCKITTEIFGRINTNKTAYTDSEGNAAKIPGGFAVGTSDNVNKVTGGLVIQDSEGNQFVWIPVGDVKKDGITTTITLGRYEFNTTNGTPTLKQDADNYTQTVTLNGYAGAYYQELPNNSGNTAAKNLGDFVSKTKANGGYYLGRYEASGGSGNTTGSVKAQYNQPVWTDIAQPTAATNCQNMYQGNSYVESDLINSYAWDTAIVFIQKYGGNSNYANKASVNDSSVGKLNTGKAGDKICNIYDMASNCLEWSTEHYTGANYSCVVRGGLYNNSDYTAAFRSWGYTTANRYSFRTICYVK